MKRHHQEFAVPIKVFVLAYVSVFATGCGHQVQAQQRLNEADGNAVRNSTAPESKQSTKQNAPARLEPSILQVPPMFVDCLALSPDGMTLATGGVESFPVGRAARKRNPQPRLRAPYRDAGPDGLVILWDAASGKEKATLRHASGWHWRKIGNSPQGEGRPASGRVWSVAFSPDGKLLATGTGAGAKLWDAKSGQEIATLFGYQFDKPAEENEQILFGVMSVAFSPDSKVIATVTNVEYGQEPRIELWDVTTPGHAQKLAFPDRLGSCVAFSPDGATFAVGGDTVTLWDFSTRRQIAKHRGESELWRAVEFSPDGTLLCAIGSSPARRWQGVQIWDIGPMPNGPILHERAAIEVRGTSLEFSPDSKILAVCGGPDHAITLWDVAKGTRIAVPDYFGGNAVSFSPDGKTLAVGGWEGYKPHGSAGGLVRFWDVAQAIDPEFVAAQEKAVVADILDALMQRREAVTAFKIIEVMGRERTLAQLAEAAVNRDLDARSRFAIASLLALYPEGAKAAVPALTEALNDADPNVRKHAEELLKKIEAATSTRKLDIGPRAVVFSPEGTRLVSGNGDGSATIWDLATGQEVVTLDGHTGPVSSVAFSPDGTRLATAGWGKITILWDTAANKEALRLNGHAGNVNSVAFSPDGKRLASGSSDRTIKLWDTATGQEVLSLKGHTGFVRSVAFSPDGKRLASAGGKGHPPGPGPGELKLWDALSGQETATLKGHTEAVTRLEFSPDGKRLASASGDRTVKLWDTATGQETITLEGHTGPVLSVAFSRDHTRLATASFDRTIKVWNSASGQEVLTLARQNESVTEP